MPRFTAIDLSKLPPPAVVETLSFETICAAMLADLYARMPELQPLLESDPAMKVVEVAAYREVLLRQRVNDAARAGLLAFATGADLEHMAARLGVVRLAGETDDRLRRRVQLAPEAFAAAGSVGAYSFHALSADVRVRDVSVTSPMKGQVVVTILSTEAGGVPSDAVLEAVRAQLAADDACPLTDSWLVRRPRFVDYDVRGRLYLYDGPDSTVVLAAARKGLAAYTEAQFALGRDVTLSGLYAALHQGGVQRVELDAPLQTIAVDDLTVARLGTAAIEVAGRDE